MNQVMDRLIYLKKINDMQLMKGGIQNRAKISLIFEFV